MKRQIQVLLFLVITIFAWLPVANLAAGHPFYWLHEGTIVALNLIAWSCVIHSFLINKEIRKSINKIAGDLGIDVRLHSMEGLLSRIIREVRRKNSSLSINLIERRISSKEELARTLERIVALAFRLLDAESAELALFDSESSLYHSSFVLGKPFRRSSQAMLSGAAEGDEPEPSPDVLVQPIAFAGSVLGSLRVALKKGALPTSGDQEIMRVLALQSGLAIINAEYTEELVRMKMASEESVKAKTGFLANLSHELRGPLGIMLNAVELVLDGLCGTINEDQLETLRMVRTNGEHLLELINDVLDYAKIESGKINPNPEKLLVNDLLKDISNIGRTQAENKSHKLSYKKSDEVLAIECDRRHIRQMLINLTTNAIKYTPDGGTIELWAERIPGSRIKINVRDSGIGIGESERHKVFSAFERIENAYSINQVGTGLGMPLTKRLAEVNGGQIDFSSKPSEGSHFWLIFPAVEFDRSELNQEGAQEIEAKGAGEVILLVESDEGERNMVARYLRHVGYKVVAVGTQLEAMDLLRMGNVELAMIDNKVVDQPHEDVIKAIRETARSSMLPIILVTTRAFVFDIEKYLRSGIDRVLTKPVALKELSNICRGLIDGDHNIATQ